MTKKIFTLFIVAFSIIQFSLAQELNCKVQVVTQRATTTDPQVFKTLQTAIYEFMNNRKWTGDSYTNNERIECSIFLNITDDNGSGKFGATATIQSSRHAFNSSYNSVLLNIADQQWTFEYIQFQPLEYTDNIFTSSLTSLLAFYAHIIIGIDNDSYSLKGGTTNFERALQVMNNVPQNADFSAGWRPTDGLRNRYWLIENIQNPKFEVFRQINYDYHRTGIDKMYDNINTSRQVITACVKKLESVASSNPNAMILQQFFAAKSPELINIYSKASPQEKAEMVNLLTKLDPVNGQKYAAMK
jgi:hypothetical protein